MKEINKRPLNVAVNSEPPSGIDYAQRKLRRKAPAQVEDEEIQSPSTQEPTTQTPNSSTDSQVANVYDDDPGFIYQDGILIESTLTDTLDTADALEFSGNLSPSEVPSLQEYINFDGFFLRDLFLDAPWQMETHGTIESNHWLLAQAKNPNVVDTLPPKPDIQQYIFTSGQNLGAYILAPVALLTALTPKSDSSTSTTSGVRTVIGQFNLGLTQQVPSGSSSNFRAVLYDQTGAVLGKDASLQTNNSVTFSLDKTVTYTGGVMMVIYSTAPDADVFFDNSSATSTALSVYMRSVAQLTSQGDLTMQVNPLTEMVTRSFGLKGGASGTADLKVPVLGAENIQKRAEVIRNLFTSDTSLTILTDPVVPRFMYDTSGFIVENPNMNEYGKILNHLDALNKYFVDFDTTLNSILVPLDRGILDGTTVLQLNPGIADKIILLAQSVYHLDATALEKLAPSFGITTTDLHTKYIPNQLYANPTYLNSYLVASGNGTPIYPESTPIVLTESLSGDGIAKLKLVFSGESLTLKNSQDTLKLGSLPINVIAQGTAGTALINNVQVNYLIEVNIEANTFTLSLTKQDLIAPNFDPATIPNILADINLVTVSDTITNEVNSGERFVQLYFTTSTNPRDLYVALSTVTVDNVIPRAPPIPILNIVSDGGLKSNDGILNENNAELLIQGDKASPQDTIYVFDRLSYTDPITNTPTSKDILLAQTRADAGGNWAVSTKLANTNGKVATKDYPATEGSHVLIAHSVDLAGNSSLVSPALTLLIDTTKPAPPGIAPISDTGVIGDGLTSNKSMVVSGLESNSQWEYKIDSTGTWVSGGTVTTFIGFIGGHTYFTRQTDVAGNVSSENTVSLVVDQSIPLPPSLSLISDTGVSSTDRITNHANVLVVFPTNEPITNWTYQIDNSATILNGNGSILTASEGSHIYRVQVYDVANNASNSASIGFTLDSSANSPTPSILDTGSSNMDGITSSPNVNVATEPNATWQYSIDQGNWQDGTSTSFQALEGLHSYSIRQTDVAGNISLPRTPFAVNLDFSAPNFLRSFSNASGDKVWLYFSELIAGGNSLPARTNFNLKATPSGQQIANNLTVTSLETSGNYLILGLDSKIKVGDALSLNYIDDPDLNNSATIQDLAGNDAYSISDSIITNYVLASNNQKAPTLSNMSWGIASSPSNGVWLSTGDTIKINVVFDQFMQVKLNDTVFDTSSSPTTFPDITLSLSIGSKTRSAKFTGYGGNTNGSDTLEFTYTITSGDNSIFDANINKYIGISVPASSLVIGSNVKIQNNNGIDPASLSFTGLNPNDNFLVDTVPPNALTFSYTDTGSSSTDKISSHPTITVSNLSTESNAWWRYQIDSNNWVVGVGSTFSAIEGTHTYYLQQLDYAGNTSALTTFSSFVLDRAPPANLLLQFLDTGTNTTDGVSNSPTLSVSGLFANASWQYKVDDLNWVAGTGIVFSALVGSHNYSVRQIDVAGNTGAATSKTMVYLNGTSTPTLSFVDTGSNTSDLLTNNPRISIAGLQVLSTWQYQVDGTGNWLSGTGSFLSAQSGQHSYQVRQLDIAGNTSLPSTSISLDLDLQNPQFSTAYTNSSGSELTVVFNEPLSTNVSAQTFFVYAGPSNQLVSIPVINASIHQNLVVLTLESLLETEDVITGVNPNGSQIISKRNYTVFVSYQGPSIVNNQLPIADIAGNTAQDFTRQSVSNYVLNADDRTPANLTSINISKVVGGMNNYYNQGDTIDFVVQYSKIVSINGSVRLGLDVGGISKWADYLSGSGSSNLIFRYTVANGDNDPNGITVKVNALNFDNGSILDGNGIVASKTNALIADNAAFLIDTSPPPAPVIAFTDTGSSSTDSITYNPTVSISSINLTDNTWRFVVDGSILGTPPTGSSTFQALAGSHTYQAVSLDKAGNSSTYSAAITINLVTTQPTAILAQLASDTGTSTSDFITSNPTLLISNVTAGNTWEYTTMPLTNIWNAGVGNSLIVPSDGKYSYYIRQVDIAGNTSPSHVLSFTLDTGSTPPSLSLLVDTGTSSSDGVTMNPTILVSGLETNTAWQWNMDNESTWNTGSGSTFTASSGSHTYRVRQTDVVLNSSGPGSDFVVHYDATPPGSIALTLGSKVLSSTPTLTVDGLESNARWRYSLDGSASSTIVSSGSTLVALSGIHSYKANQIDLAGNIGPETAIFQVAAMPSSLPLGIANGVQLNLTGGVALNQGTANPVKVYYFLDTDNNNSINPADTLTHNVLDGIFNSGNDTSEASRTRQIFANSTTYNVLLPTQDELLTLFNSFQNSEEYQGWLTNVNYWTATPGTATGTHNYVQLVLANSTVGTALDVSSLYTIFQVVPA
ncbi:MAG: Ig-like domain-containing protein [Gammaproteobacteria bacterium]|nr:Ig-like domain-containing protein [Gammaproteobacteria bacterium]